MRRKLLYFGLTWLMISALGIGCVFAEDQAPVTAKPLPQNVEFAAGSNHVDIRTVQEKLIELGYYEGDITYQMDNNTLYALKLFCEANQLDYSAEGMTKQAYAALLSAAPLVPRVTPRPTGEQEYYETLLFGQVSDMVLNAQIRLKELGYYEGEQLNPQHYDWGFQAAINAFCTDNSIAYDPETLQVTESIQRLIFSNAAVRRGETSSYVQATDTPQPTRPADMKYLLGDTGTDIRRMQEKLAELGYFAREFSYEFDLDTLYALNQMCYENQLYSSEYGISQEVWEVLFGGQKLVSVTAAPGQGLYAKDGYGPVAFGQTGENVTAMQIQLKALGYFTGDVVLGEYEEETQRAVELFCSFNGIDYSGDGIDAQLHAAIFSDAAVPYNVQTPQLGLFERVRIFLTEKQSVFGLSIPGWGWAAAAVVLLAGFIILIVWLFTGRSSAQTPLSVSGVQGSVSHTRVETSVTEVEKMYLADISIRYRGQERRERIRIVSQCVIGRGEECELRLDEADRNMSRKHCSVMISGGGLVLKDHSVNGTFVNDKHYHKSECILHSGDRIQIGQHLLVIKF